MKQPSVETHKHLWSGTSDNAICVGCGVAKGPSVETKIEGFVCDICKQRFADVSAIVTENVPKKGKYHLDCFQSVSKALSAQQAQMREEVEGLLRKRYLKLDKQRRLEKDHEEKLVLTGRMTEIVDIKPDVLAIIEEKR